MLLFFYEFIHITLIISFIYIKLEYNIKTNKRDYYLKIEREWF